MEMLSRRNTQALKGFAAVMIVVFHIVLRFKITAFFNMWGGLFVAVFLILSGFGIEESYRRGGLDGFWRKRLDKVVLPTVFFVCAYNFFFPHFFSDFHLSSDGTLHWCLDELLYIRPAFWFVFFIMKCYAVYWLGTRFLSGRVRMAFFVACALVCLNLKAPCGHLEAEQSLSFLAGVWLSTNRSRVEALSDGEVKRWTLLLLGIGALFCCLKLVPPLHELRGSIAYNYLLCPFRLSTGLAAIPLMTMLRLGESRLMQVAGKYSLEIYLAHIPFIGMMVDAGSIGVFLLCSVLGFLLLLAYRRYIQGRVSAAATLYIIINAVFVAKYAGRVSEDVGFYATLAVVAGYLLVTLHVSTRSSSPEEEGLLQRSSLRRWWMHWWRRLALALAIAGMLVVQYAINPYGVQVDRWSALHFPIQNLLSGVYPYSATTHLGGNASPFPVWQVLHIPFYLLGNVGLSFFAGLALFLWSCRKVQGKETAVVVGLLACVSTAVWYEVAVRSDLITNMLVVAALINLCIRRINQAWIERWQWWIAASVGLLASTRMLVLVPIAVLLLPYFGKMSPGRQWKVVLLTLAAFTLTFAPFAIWDWHEFYFHENNPWSLQTRQGNLSDFILLVPLAILLAMNHEGSEERYYRNAALMLAAFVGITFVHNMYLGQNWDIFSSTFDITYFSAALPFCLLAMAGKSDEAGR